MRYILSIILLISLAVSSCAAVTYPVIFIHGTGDSSVAWKTTGPAVSKYIKNYYGDFSAGSGISRGRLDKDESDNIRNSCVYLVFSDHFDDPKDLVVELDRVIEETRSEVWRKCQDKFSSKQEIKVNLVCHSMGGLVARKYLIDNINDHYVSKVIFIGTPNKGSAALNLNWVPAGLMIGGFSSFILSGNPLFLSVSVVGATWDAVSRSMGVKLISKSTEAMKPDSTFINDLNKSPMPVDVEYSVILCSSDDFLHKSVNNIFGYKDGDGAVSFDSQSLRYADIPNFDLLIYEEVKIVSSHPEDPTNAKEAIIEVLGLKD